MFQCGKKCFLLQNQKSSCETFLNYDNWKRKLTLVQTLIRHLLYLSLKQEMTWGCAHTEISTYKRKVEVRKERKKFLPAEQVFKHTQNTQKTPLSHKYAYKIIWPTCQNKSTPDVWHSARPTRTSWWLACLFEQLPFILNCIYYTRLVPVVLLKTWLIQLFVWFKIFHFSLSGNIKENNN